MESRVVYPLSQTQLGIYVECASRKGEVCYNIPYLYTLSKQVDIEKMAETLNRVVNSHSYLLSRIERDDNGEIWLKRDERCEFAASIEEIGDIASVKDSLVQPFDLDRDPLIRARLIATPQNNYLFVDIHHIIFDMYSDMIFIGDLNCAYSGAEIFAEEYSGFDVALEEQRRRSSAEYEEAKQWHEDNYGRVEGDSLPMPDKRSEGESYTKEIITSKAAVGAVSALCKSHGIGQSVFFNAAFAYFLARYTNSSNSLFTTIYNGRGDEKCRRTISMMVKTLAIHQDLSKMQTRGELIDSVKRQLAEAKRYDLFSFAECCQRFGITSNLMFAYQGNASFVGESFAGGEFLREDLRVNDSNAHLSIQIFKSADSYTFECEYRSDLYSDNLIHELLQSFDSVVCNMLSKERLSEIQLLSAERQEQIIELSRGEELEYDKNDTIVDVILRNGDLYPDSVAVVDKCSQITYRELASYSNCVAAKLIEMGVAADDYVGVMVPRRKEFSVAQMAVMRSGAAYVPMDVDYPNDRIEYMLKDSKAKVLITTRELYAQKQAEGDFEVENLLYIEEIEASAEHAPINKSTPDSLAYMIYTSGSTGLPKGVMIPHKAIAMFVLWHSRLMEMDHKTNVALHFSFSFDGSFLDSIPPLFVGGTLHIIGSQMRRDLDALYEYLCEKRIDAMTIPTQLGMELVNRYEELPLRVLGFGGEKLLPVSKTKTKLINYYGPTEFTVASSFYVIDQSVENIPIGRPAPNSSSFILDKQGNLMPRGVAGELCLMGVQIANGYWQREELTAEKFVECKFMEGEKIYRTGDLARWNADGELEFLGRIDNQVKLRGFRIELGEIENQVKTYDKILSAVVEVREIAGVQHLCAYYTAESEIDKESLKEHISQSLTDYMVPTAYIQMEAMPLTPNGKVDRKKLPQPEIELDEIIAPESEMEIKLFEIVAELFGTRHFGVTNNLISLGLTSLLSIRLSSLIGKMLEVKVPIKEILQSPTIESLATYIESLSESEEEETKSYEKRQYYPLTENQRGLYVDWEMNRATTQYNIPTFVRFEEIDSDRLERALKRVINNHTGLKSHLAMVDGEVVVERCDEKEIAIKRTKKDGAATKEELQSRLLPFDLFLDELSRFEIIEASDATYLFMDIHHIIFDGGSTVILFADLGAAYNGEEISGESFTPFDRALQEQEILTPDYLSSLDEYFDALVSNSETTTYPHSTTDLESGSRFYQTTIKGEHISPLLKSLGATASNYFLAMTMQALHRHTREEYVQISTISNGRGDLRLSDSIGMFVKTLPAVSRQQNISVEEAVKGMQSQMIETISRDIYPFTRLVERSGVGAEIMYLFQQDFSEALPFANSEFVSVDVDTTKLPITIQISQTASEDYALSIEYDGALYNSDAMRLLAESIKTLSESATSKDEIITNVPMISPKEQAEIIELSRGEEIEYDKTETIVDVILRNGDLYPDSVAVVDKCSQITYREFALYSNCVAAKLIEMGVTASDYVGVMLPRRKEFSVAQIAVMRSGAAYVPMDVDYPNDRIEYMLKDSKAKVLITSRELYAQKQKDSNFEVENLLYIEDVELSAEIAPINNSTPEGLAYMIYTSGSTGLPKGVMISHKAIALFVGWYAKLERIDHNSICALHLNLSFDGSFTDSIPPLYVGATLHIINSGMCRDLDGLYNYICKNKIETICFPTQFGMEFVNSYGDLPLRFVGFGGEKLLPMAKTNSRLINFYGPTEFTVTSTYYEVDQDEENIPIGRPSPNSSNFIVDLSGNLLPRGVAGELCLMGDQIANGYWQREELTAEKFVECKFMKGQKYYRTGDLARWNADGMLEFLGRIDNQVKLRGFRIELGEIENQVKSFDNILASVVEVREIGGVQHLCAYYTADVEIDKKSLKEHISKSLTEYMVPTAYMQMEVMPLTPNGKVDRKKLPQPQIERTTEYIAPRNEYEREMCRLFGEQLSLEQVSVNDDYFLIGGTSLSAIRLVIEIGKLGYDVKYSDLFNLKTPEKIAEFIGGESGDQSTADESHFDLSNYDYSAIDELLKESYNIDRIYDSEPYVSKSVLLTGATGYLGVYLLNRLTMSGASKIYCLVRPSKRISAIERVKSIYAYYFDDLEVFESGLIEVVEGDITDSDIVDKLSCYEVDTLINPAAMVKHFVSDDSMYRVNVGGVENLISLCERNKARLIHVSTYSVAAMKEPQSHERLTEAKLYFGQHNNNEYIHTKFLAERALLQAIADGRVDGKVMRVGNLMGRENDGEFQINFRSNAFLNSIKSYKVLQAFPLKAMNSAVEVSPINRVAEAIVTLTATPREMVVFHPYNPYSVDMGAVVKAMNGYGFGVNLLNDGQFKARVKELSQDAAKSIHLQGLIHYTASGITDLVETPTDNNFTTTLLYHLGFYWSVANNDYFSQLLESLDLLGFFDE